MTDEKIRALIAEGEQRIGVNRLGKVNWRETDKDILVIRKLVLALSALTVPDGDVRERLIQLALAHVPILGAAGTGKVIGCRCMDRVFMRGRETWAEHIADAIQAAFPVLSRDIAGEIEADKHPVADERVEYFNAGLERAAEIVRSGR